MSGGSLSRLWCLLATLLVGCAPTPMYYWGDYSESIYAYRKEATEKNLLSHRDKLIGIIDISNERATRVPPGIYAELGYIYDRTNLYKEAVANFCKEEELYPESKILMDRLIEHIKKRSDETLGLCKPRVN